MLAKRIYKGILWLTSYYIEESIMGSFCLGITTWIYALWEAIKKLPTFELILFAISIVSFASLFAIIAFFKKEEIRKIKQLQNDLTIWEKLGIILPSATERQDLPRLMAEKDKQIFSTLNKEDTDFLKAFLTEEEKGYLRNYIFAFTHCEPAYFDRWHKLRLLINKKIEEL